MQPENSPTNFKFKVLQPYLEEDFSSYEPQSIALECLRRVKCRKTWVKEDAMFADTVRNFITYLHNYNMNVFNISSVYPYCEEFYELLHEYVHLECKILYKIPYHYSKVKETQVQTRILRLLINIYTDYFRSKMIPSKEVMEQSAMAIYSIFVKVKIDYPKIPKTDYKILSNMRDILIKHCFDDDSKLNKSETMPEEDKGTNNDIEMISVEIEETTNENVDVINHVNENKILSSGEVNTIDEKVELEQIIASNKSTFISEIENSVEENLLSTRNKEPEELDDTQTKNSTEKIELKRDEILIEDEKRDYTDILTKLDEEIRKIENATAKKWPVQEETFDHNQFFMQPKVTVLEQNLLSAKQNKNNGDFARITSKKKVRFNLNENSSSENNVATKSCFVVLEDIGKKSHKMYEQNESERSLIQPESLTGSNKIAADKSSSENKKDSLEEINTENKEQISTRSQSEYEQIETQNEDRESSVQSEPLKSPRQIVVSKILFQVLEDIRKKSPKIYEQNESERSLIQSESLTRSNKIAADDSSGKNKKDWEEAEESLKNTQTAVENALVPDQWVESVPIKNIEVEIPFANHENSCSTVKQETYDSADTLYNIILNNATSAVPPTATPLIPDLWYEIPFNTETPHESVTDQWQQNTEVKNLSFYTTHFTDTEESNHSEELNPVEDITSARNSEPIDDITPVQDNADTDTSSSKNEDTTAINDTGPSGVSSKIKQLINLHKKIQNKNQSVSKSKRQNPMVIPSRQYSRTIPSDWTRSPGTSSPVLASSKTDKPADPTDSPSEYDTHNEARESSVESERLKSPHQSVVTETKKNIFLILEEVTNTENKEQISTRSPKINDQHESRTSKSKKRPKNASYNNSHRSDINKIRNTTYLETNMTKPVTTKEIPHSNGIEILDEKLTPVQDTADADTSSSKNEDTTAINDTGPSGVSSKIIKQLINLYNLYKKIQNKNQSVKQETYDSSDTLYNIILNNATSAVPPTATPLIPDINKIRNTTYLETTMTKPVTTKEIPHSNGIEILDEKLTPVQDNADADTSSSKNEGYSNECDEKLNLWSSESPQNSSDKLGECSNDFDEKLYLWSSDSPQNISDKLGGYSNDFDEKLYLGSSDPPQNISDTLGGYSNECDEKLNLWSSDSPQNSSDKLGECSNDFDEKLYLGCSDSPQNISNKSWLDEIRPVQEEAFDHDQLIMQPKVTVSPSEYDTHNEARESSVESERLKSPHQSVVTETKKNIFLVLEEVTNTENKEQISTRSPKINDQHESRTSKAKKRPKNASYNNSHRSDINKIRNTTYLETNMTKPVTTKEIPHSNGIEILDEKLTPVQDTADADTSSSKNEDTTAINDTGPSGVSSKIIKQLINLYNFYKKIQNKNQSVKQETYDSSDTLYNIILNNATSAVPPTATPLIPDINKIRNTTYLETTMTKPVTTKEIPHSNGIEILDEKLTPVQDTADADTSSSKNEDTTSGVSSKIKQLINLYKKIQNKNQSVKQEQVSSKIKQLINLYKKIQNKNQSVKQETYDSSDTLYNIILNNATSAVPPTATPLIPDINKIRNTTYLESTMTQNISNKSWLDEIRPVQEEAFDHDQLIMQPKVTVSEQNLFKREELTLTNLPENDQKLNQNATFEIADLSNGDPLILKIGDLLKNKENCYISKQIQSQSSMSSNKEKETVKKRKQSSSSAETLCKIRKSSATDLKNSYALPESLKQPKKEIEENNTWEVPNASFDNNDHLYNLLIPYPVVSNNSNVFNNRTTSTTNYPMAENNLFSPMQNKNDGFSTITSKKEITFNFNGPYNQNTSDPLLNSQRISDNDNLAMDHGFLQGAQMIRDPFGLEVSEDEESLNRRGHYANWDIDDSLVIGNSSIQSESLTRSNKIAADYSSSKNKKDWEEAEESLKNTQTPVENALVPDQWVETVPIKNIEVEIPFANHENSCSTVKQETYDSADTLYNIILNNATSAVPPTATPLIPDLWDEIPFNTETPHESVADQWQQNTEVKNLSFYTTHYIKNIEVEIPFANHESLIQPESLTSSNKIAADKSSSENKKDSLEDINIENIETCSNLYDSVKSRKRQASSRLQREDFDRVYDKLWREGNINRHLKFPHNQTGTSTSKNQRYETTHSSHKRSSSGDLNYGSKRKSSGSSCNNNWKNGDRGTSKGPQRYSSFRPPSDSSRSHQESSHPHPESRPSYSSYFFRDNREPNYFPRSSSSSNKMPPTVSPSNRPPPGSSSSSRAPPPPGYNCKISF